MSDVRTARSLISVVELVGVRLIDIRASTRVSLSQDIPSATIEFSHKASATAGDEVGGFLVVASIDVQIKPEEEQNQPLVRIRAKLELRYRLPVDFVPSKKQLNAFARVNAIYNAWPYFREIVQSVSGRMDLPPLVLPVYRIPRPNSERKTSTPRPAGSHTAKGVPVQSSKAPSNATN